VLKQQLLRWLLKNKNYHKALRLLTLQLASHKAPMSGSRQVPPSVANVRKSIMTGSGATPFQQLPSDAAAVEGQAE